MNSVGHEEIAKKYVHKKINCQLKKLPNKFDQRHLLYDNNKINSEI